MARAIKESFAATFRRSTSGGKDLIRLTEDQFRRAYAEYAAGTSGEVVAKRIGVSWRQFYGAYRRRGLKSRPVNRSYRRRFVDESAFSRLTAESAYWLGFLMADGYVGDGNGSPCLKVTLSAVDRAQLIALRRFLKSNHKIYAYKSVTARYGLRRFVQYSVNSARLVADLERYGVVRGKSGREQPGVLSRNVDFWRGVLDGDGALFIGKQPKDLSLILCGGKRIVSDFAAYCYPICGGRPYILHPHNGIFSVRFGGQRAIRLVEHFYDRGGPALPRKKRLAERILKLPRKKPKRWISPALKNEACALYHKGTKIHEIRRRLRLPQITLYRILAERRVALRQDHPKRHSRERDGAVRWGENNWPNVKRPF